MKSIIQIFLIFMPFFVQAEIAVPDKNDYSVFFPTGHNPDSLQNQIVSEKDPLTAFLLCVFFGPLGMHRMYLGTSVTTAVAYVVTGGGFGIAWVIDTCLLFAGLFQKDINRYQNNNHFFMWQK